jgi:hypothetical protein
MITALAFGFVQVYFPIGHYSFERLHIFLFNLCTGGTIILYYTCGQKKASWIIMAFFAGSLIYALSAFLELYPLTLLVSPVLVFLVEKVRTERFGFLPVRFFRSSEPVHEKFHHACLLCLSIGLCIASAAVVNDAYLHVVTMEKFTLNTFFLGFSFPLSLITLSVVFSMLKHVEAAGVIWIMEICFWTITLGVIVFFIFILLEKFIPQIFVSSALFIAVIIVLVLYSKYARKIQQKLFLTSGTGFLVFTAVTGIAYIVLQMSDTYDPMKVKWLIQMHVFASLYGWNLCGLAVICRFNDFPIRLHSMAVIAAHWLTAIVLAPMGVFYPVFAVFAVMGYAFITLTLFFSTNTDKGI